MSYFFLISIDIAATSLSQSFGKYQQGGRRRRIKCLERWRKLLSRRLSGSKLLRAMRCAPARIYIHWGWVDKKKPPNFSLLSCARLSANENENNSTKDCWRLAILNGMDGPRNGNFELTLRQHISKHIGNSILHLPPLSMETPHVQTGPNDHARHRHHDIHVRLRLSPANGSHGNYIRPSGATHRRNPRSVWIFHHLHHPFQNVSHRGCAGGYFWRRLDIEKYNRFSFGRQRNQKRRDRPDW